jgi:hypothetical protein
MLLILSFRRAFKVVEREDAESPDEPAVMQNPKIVANRAGRAEYRFDADQWSDVLWAGRQVGDSAVLQQQPMVILRSVRRNHDVT